ERRIAVGDYPLAGLLVDLDGDGVLDLVTTSYYSLEILVMAGRGDGTFGPAARYSVSAPAVGVEAADFDEDGRVDLVVAQASPPGPGGLSVLRGAGGGEFHEEEVVELRGSCPGALAPIDLDRDGAPDLLVA